MIQQFDELKNSFQELSEKQKLTNLFNSNLDKVTWNDYLEFYENPDESSEKNNEIINTTIDKEKLKSIIERKIDLDAKLFKELIKEYRTDKVRNKAKLRTALNLYIENIRPSSEKLFNLNYGEVIIEERDWWWWIWKKA